VDELGPHDDGPAVGGDRLDDGEPVDGEDRTDGAEDAAFPSSSSVASPNAARSEYRRR